MDLCLILWCPVGQYWLFTLVFECPIPNTLDDFSELFSALLRWHEMRSTDKYINIAIHMRSTNKYINIAVHTLI